MAEYRIDYTITRRGPGEDDFTEIGFGSTGASATVDQAAFELESSVQNRLWETGPGMPAPEEAE